MLKIYGVGSSSSYLSTYSLLKLKFCSTFELTQTLFNYHVKTETKFGWFELFCEFWPMFCGVPVSGADGLLVLSLDVAVTWRRGMLCILIRLAVLLHFALGFLCARLQIAVQLV